MLTCKDIAYKRNEKGEVVEQKVYDRIYFEFGSADPIEERDKTVGGKSIGKIQVPKADKTVMDHNDLFAETITYLQDVRKVSEPLLHVLRFFSKGDDLATRPTFTADKPVDVDKATEAAAKKLVALGLFSSVAEASADIRARREAKLATA